MANRVGVVRTRYYLDDLSSPEIPDRPPVDFAQARFAML